METKFGISTVLAFILTSNLCWKSEAQTLLPLRITNDTATSIQIDWASEPDISYRLLLTEAIDPFSQWIPVNDFLATETNTSASVSTENFPAGFFKVHVWNESFGLPTARMVWPTNGAVIAGPISVLAGAQDDSRLTVVSLYLDDALIGYLESGDLRLGLDTSHFSNGTHTLHVASRDDADNETESETLTVTFDNPVRWMNPNPMFDAMMPIELESDIVPADWTVFVETLSGETVRVFDGSSLDGTIQTSWDGKDQNGNDAPSEQAYRITVVVAENSGMAMSSGSLGYSVINSAAKVNSVVNQFGAVDYEEGIAENTSVTEERKVISLNMETKGHSLLPPLPKPAPKAAIRKFSARELFMTQFEERNKEGESANASSSVASGSTMAVAWREFVWQSGNIVLSRQHIPGFTGVLWNGTIASHLNNVQSLVALSEDSVGAHRGVYQNSVQVMQNPGNYTGLTNALNSQNPDVRAFYWYGHGSQDGNSFGGGNVRATNIAQMLGNTWTNLVLGTNPPLQSAFFHKPFSFVFLDGCMTGNGIFPEAFGIPKATKPQQYEPGRMKPRAFMGWGGKVTLGILNNDFLNWSQKFWEEWLKESEGYNLPLGTAINRANAFRPGVTNTAPLRVYGTRELRWSD